MPKVTEALENFLLARKREHNGPDLIDAWSPAMETQVLVTGKGGEPVEGRPNTYTDGRFTWFNIRVPKKADSNPEWFDYELPYPFDLYADGIGVTGWDWQSRCSRRVGFDFDAIAGHAAGVGVTDEKLNEVKQKAMDLDYVEVRRSTSGSGLHLWVTLDAIPTENHTVHAALARCVLSLMSEACGFDFAQSVDACGGNMWIWHRKSTTENEGLKLLKAATKSLSEKDLPLNWRDHVEVVTKKRSKIRIAGIPEDELEEFEKLTLGSAHVPLDDSHRAQMQAIAELGYSCVWVQDHHLCQTHTRALKEIHQTLQLRGFFDTSSEGRDKGTPNCFMIPRAKGSWHVVRFSKGIHEHELWSQDGVGYTSILFNIAPDLHSASLALGGVELNGGKGYHFDSLELATKVISTLGGKFTPPEAIKHRETVLVINNDGRIGVEVHRSNDDPASLPGFAKNKSGKLWTRLLSLKAERNKEEIEHEKIDEIVRSLVSPAGERIGWVTRSLDGTWVRGPKDDAKSVLLSIGNTRADVDQILGSAALKHWMVVTLPFRPEYPGNRQWNRDAAQLRYEPAELDYDEKPHHPHWDLILSHLGSDLDEAIAGLEWCQLAGIKTGRDYLMHWIACMIREPFEPLPYNFFFGPQNSGKSISHEAIDLLLTRGVVAADRALTAGNDFNGELEGAVLCVVEEKDISKSPNAYNRMKDWVTARKLSIRRMRQDSYSVINTTHWIQCANDQSNCPIMRGDTRINVIYVPALENEIPKVILIDHLEKEAPHFLRSLMNLELPRVQGRLRLPVIETTRKEKSIEIMRSSLELFISEKCYDSPGHYIKFADFKKAFHEWLEPLERTEWNQTRISRELPEKHPTARRGDTGTWIGNLSFSQHTDDLQRVTARNGKFVNDLSGAHDQ